MENRKMITEEIYRIKEIMGIPINEVKDISGPWYLNLIDEVADVLRVAGRTTVADELMVVRQLFSRTAMTQAELDSAVYQLFRRNSSYYPELISYIRTNYASKIEEAAYDVARLGKKLKDEGIAASDIEMEMKKFYDKNTTGSYLGDDIKEDIINKAKADVAAHTPAKPPVTPVTQADADSIWNSIKNKPEYQDIFKRFGPELELEFQSASKKLLASANQDLGTFVRELDSIIATWQKAHPYVDKTFWTWFRKTMTKMWLSKDAAGGIIVWMSMLKILRNTLILCWAWRVVVRKYAGQDWGTSVGGALKDDIIGTIGAAIEIVRSLGAEVIPDAPFEPIAPDEVPDIKNEY